MVNIGVAPADTGDMPNLRSLAGHRLPRPRRVAAVADDDRLVERSRAQERAALGGREARVTAALGAGFAVACVAVNAATWGRVGHDPVAMLVLLAAYTAAARVGFEVGSGIALPTQLVFVPMLFLAPATAPVLVALGFALSTLPEQLRGDWHSGRLGLHLVSAGYALGPVAVLWAAGFPAPTLTAAHLGVLAAALLAGFALDFAGWAALGHAPRTFVPALASAWKVDVALTLPAFALAAVDRTHAYAFLLGLPLVWLLREFARDRTVFHDRAEELRHAYRGTALLLGDMVEADDAYTGLHSQDVVSLVLAVADRLGLDEAERQNAELTALLHDVGKVSVPKEIIRKPGPLTAAERAVIETHTVAGERMLEQVGGLLGHVGRLVRSCHEHWDGGGYPDGLAGERIPLVARIVCACDAFSAMTTDRSYRRALPRAVAVEELRRCAGTQFDPDVVAALVAVVAEPAPSRLATAA
jgi:HD-GYP domain-containing protein (c-di-GMP phosphodiesterase class II)